MIEITEDKYEELAENAEKMLRHGGKIMSCIDSIRRERMGERIPDYRNGGRNYEWDDEDRIMERRGGHRNWTHY